MFSCCWSCCNCAFWLAASCAFACKRFVVGAVPGKKSGSALTRRRFVVDGPADVPAES